ncbi:calmodulin-2/4-like [Impatiens glandulifera]|uniref:calmodulin-2/4-like n=1 Tax=Impatiens glandulifera TaxID=253017 RepID=UPI001FB0C8AE|nr:calmodulin-2/4-like [Impatiens glandulifera]
MMKDQDHIIIIEFLQAFSCFIFDVKDIGYGCMMTVEELVTVIGSALDHNEDQEEEVLEENDIIEFAEFLHFLLAGQTKVQEDDDELKEAFKVFDKDEDGFISANELRHVMMNFGEKLTDEEVQHMIKEADLDGDGKVNFHEFINIITTTIPPHDQF